MLRLATTNSRYGFVRVIEYYSMTGQTFVLNMTSGLLVYNLWHLSEGPYKLDNQLLTLNNRRLETKATTYQTVTPELKD